jgi:hypothetical protein
VLRIIAYMPILIVVALLLAVLIFVTVAWAATSSNSTPGGA